MSLDIPPPNPPPLLDFLQPRSYIACITAP